MSGIIAVCKVCSKRIKGSLRISSNFIAHLRRNHPKTFVEFKKKKEENREKFGRKSSFNRDVLTFIGETCSSLSILEHRSFKKLFPGGKLPSRRSITRLLSESHKQHVTSVTNALSKIDYVCTTADVWSGGKKSFFGYTCHWLNPVNFKRSSVALACRRFKGNHSFDRITEIICQINEQYNLPAEKIVYTVTDNGSNFVKAFREFGVPLNAKRDDDFASADDSDSDSSTENSDFQFQNITPRLSKHFRCASHTLNLVATTDFTKILDSSAQETQKIHNMSFSRCAQLWKKCNRPKSAEKINAVLSAQLITPCVTRWNSLYDAVRCLLKFKLKLAELCFRLDIPSFTTNDLLYLEEYVKMMKPIAEAIDFLQGESNMLLGYFIPALVSIKVKMGRLGSENFRFLKDVNAKLQEAFVKRFEKYFSFQSESLDAVIAAVIIPDIKLKFAKTLLETAQNITEEDIKQTLNRYALEFVKEQDVPVTPSTSLKSFLDFGDEPMVDSQQNNEAGLAHVSQETGMYLADIETNLKSLDKYPTIKNMFLKYNAVLPSSAPVERLFSFAGIVNSSRRQKLSDEHFEMLVLRKATEI